MKIVYNEIVFFVYHFVKDEERSETCFKIASKMVLKPGLFSTVYSNKKLFKLFNVLKIGTQLHSSFYLL